jgi:S-adenosylmethionine:tRNA ribosyltransferase-isomerase
VRVEDLDYDLPGDRIAQVPTAGRDDARLLVLSRRSGPPAHATVRELPHLLRPGDVLAVNDARVLPARLEARRPTGGRVGVLLLQAAGEDGAWTALLGAGGTLRAGEVLALGGGDRLALLTALGEGRWTVRGIGRDVPDLMARHGRMPLPPYVTRGTEDPRDALDRERYQTVYARAEGAVAAPTAGLHLTADALARLRERGVRLAPLTLHVGLGTFAPVRVADLDRHPMHGERYEIPPETAREVALARAEGRRVVAVGTTTVRALEAAALAGGDGPLPAGGGRTDLLIQPGCQFRIVDALLTNFHLPRSTLLALVAAFAGRDRVLAAYRLAVAEGYRFYSYGDAMWIA